MSLPWSGTLRVTNEDERDSLLETVTIDLAISHETLRDQEALNASIRSVKRLLQEMHIQKWIRLKRLALTPQHAEKRCTWAQRYRYFSYLNWRRVWWSNECSVQLGKGKKLEWVFIPGGKGQTQERLRLDLVKPIPCGKKKS